MSRAFTLIEMLVTVSLIAIITAYTVVNLNFQRDERKVEREAKNFYGQLLYARNLSVSGKVFKDENNDGAPDVPNGYGMFLSAIFSSEDSVYNQQLYGDLYTSVNPKQYDFGTEEFGAGAVIDSSISVKLYIDNVLIGTLTLPQTIFFSTPRGDITYYNYLSDVSMENPPKTEIGIEFASKKNPVVKYRVVINRVSGQIYVNENP